MKAETKVEDLSLQEERKILGGIENGLPMTKLEYVIHPTLEIPQ